jgi:DNA helicase-2/ATP-dependent DNA helicase PcrA
MNWRVSQLDRFLLVSNSDAHSPQKVGREANLFAVPPTYPDLARAIRTKEGCCGTLEFFPQEGKYHLDGHRNCSLRLAPEETKRLGARCPRCGKSLTLGVMHRVLDLADREAGSPPPEAQPFQSLIGLPEVLGEVLEVRPGTKKVNHLYFRLLAELGPELAILRQTPLERLAQAGSDLLAYAIDKMRRREVHISPGYDGVYGEIHLLSPEERRQHQGQSSFWSLPVQTLEPPEQIDRKPLPLADPGEAVPKSRLTALNSSDDPLLADLNEVQQAVVRHAGSPLIVQAGPGTGKTRALAHRLAYLLERRAIPPEHILAVTFTRQAAGEMAARIRDLLPEFPGLDRLTIKTFHALGQQLLTQAGLWRETADEAQRRELLRLTAKASGLSVKSLEADIIGWKQSLRYPEDLADQGQSATLAAYRHYEELLAQKGLWDYEDLIARPVRLLQRHPELQAACQRRFRHILVDEYQDINGAQYRLCQALTGPAAEIMVIGDPDQAIYGFRGAKPEYFTRFRTDWPQAVPYRLAETYRLPPPILVAAQRLIASSGQTVEPMISRRAGVLPVGLLEASSATTEARAIAREIEKLVGGFSHRTLEDRGLRYQEDTGQVGFKDIAVLYRLHSLGVEVERALNEAGIPCRLAREGVGPDWEDIDLAAERVKLLTLHAAKGLEFSHIFIAGAEEGLLPLEWEGGVPADPEEERRLVYVGLTRASCRVVFTRARVRTLWGVKRRTRLSPLVAALAPEKLPQDRWMGSPRRRQGALFGELRPRGIKGAWE